MNVDSIKSYRSQLLIRYFEERVRELKLDGAVAGSVHLAIGQEAVPVGATAALDLTVDAVFATYRGHGWALACGVPPLELFAEILGRQGGVNGGRGGSAYFCAPRYGFFGENSIVGAGAPIAVGAALAGRHDGTNRVALTAFGDGALNQGSVTEAMNFAAAFRLPVLFVCENNRYSELTPINDMVGQPELWRRGEALGIESRRVDGNDARAVNEAVAAAYKRAKDGAGPALIEAMTERLVGHYIGDPELYRKPGELDEAVKREPLVVTRRALLTAGRTEHELAAVEAAVRTEVNEAALRALDMPPADPATVMEHRYV